MFTDSAGNRTVKRFWVDVSNYSSFIVVRMMLILNILSNLTPFQSCVLDFGVMGGDLQQLFYSNLSPNV